MPRLPIEWSSSLKIPKPKVTYSKNSIFIVAVVLDPRPVKFARGKGLKKISPLNPSKSGKITDDVNYQKVLESYLYMKLLFFLQHT